MQDQADVMVGPTSVAEIETLLRDGVQESIHLDYKRSGAMRKAARDEIAKDVSAFANSDGGVIVYGVVEKEQFPVELDEGVDDAAIDGEWIEAVVLSAITPRIDDVRIHPIPASQGRSYYSIVIQKSFRGPHQSADKCYYKRHNFSSAPMAHYEIDDVRNRRRRLEPLVSFECGFYRDFIAVFDITNIGSVPAEDVTFEFSEPLVWPEGKMPEPLRTGIHRLGPGQYLRFRYLSLDQLFSSTPMEFTVRVSYRHPDVGRRLCDEWPINFAAYRDSMHRRTEQEWDVKQAVEEIKKLTSMVESLRNTLRPLTTIANGTGLALSDRTLRNMRRLMMGEDPEPIHPEGLEPREFRDILNVDQDMAFQIFNTLSYNYDPAGLVRIPGMTPEILGRIRKRFILEEADNTTVEGTITPKVD